MNVALDPLIARYVNAVRSAGDAQWRGRSTTFWLSLGLDRRSNAHVALLRETFQAHGIDVSTSHGELGHEPPDAWIVLTAAFSRPHHRASILDLPDALFGIACDPDDSGLAATIATTTRPEPPAGVVAPAPTRLPTDVASQPVMATGGNVASPSSSGTWGDGASDTNALVVCPSCGAMVLRSASFCPICDLPQASLQEGFRYGASSTGQIPPAAHQRVGDDGWSQPNTPRPRLTFPPGTAVVIGILILSVGARLGDLLMPLVVVGTMALFGVSIWKPDVLDAVIGRGTSGRFRNGVGLSVLQIVVVVVVIVAMYVINTWTSMMSLRGGGIVP